MSDRTPIDLRGMRVAQLIESDGPGGAERMVASLATQLRSRGCEVLVVVPERGEGWLETQLAGSGVQVEHFRMDGPVSPATGAWLQSTLRRHAIDVAHSHEFTMGVYGGYAAWRAGVGHVITMHGGRYYAERWRRRVALRAAVAVSDELVAVSGRLADYLAHDLWVKRARVRTIPNGVRLQSQASSTLKTELGLAPDDPLVLAVGNLYPVKGHQYLLEALALVSSTFPRLHVAIAGRGELEAPLRQRARELGVEPRFHLLGLRADVGNLLSGADVFVMPSLSEGTPLALLEAMAAGRPIVATEVGEVPTLLDRGRAGILVKPGDAPALAEALSRLLQDRDGARRVGTLAADRAASEYGLPRMVERYAEIYAGITSPTR